MTYIGYSVLTKKVRGKVKNFVSKCKKWYLWEVGWRQYNQGVSHQGCISPEGSVGETPFSKLFYLLASRI